MPLLALCDKWRACRGHLSVHGSIWKEDRVRCAAGQFRCLLNTEAMSRRSADAAYNNPSLIG